MKRKNIWVGVESWIDMVVFASGTSFLFAFICSVKLEARSSAESENGESVKRFQRKGWESGW